MVTDSQTTPLKMQKISQNKLKWLLKMKPVSNKVPMHIAIILDGNRRFAKRLMMKPWKGHEWGEKKVEDLLTWCDDLKIKELTLYTFSLENFNRPKKELDYLMKIFKESFEKIKVDPRLKENSIKVNFIGRIEMFPSDVTKAMRELEKKTKNNSAHIINFAMAYGGQDEIVEAAKKIAQKVKEGKLDIKKINKETFEDNLYMKDSPDMIIRTGGEKRSSNFLPYQSAYSEWFYIEKMWPEFEKEDFIKCIKEFGQRQRRFGA